MKKIILLLTLIFLSGCATLRYDPEPGSEIILTGFDGVKNIEAIKAWKKPFQKGEQPFTKLKPGTKVKLIDINGPMALIELPDGEKVWIQKIFIK